MTRLDPAQGIRNAASRGDVICCCVLQHARVTDVNCLRFNTVSHPSRRQGANSALFSSPFHEERRRRRQPLTLLSGPCTIPSSNMKLAKWPSPQIPTPFSGPDDDGGPSAFEKVMDA